MRARPALLGSLCAFVGMVMAELGQDLGQGLPH